MLHQLLPCRHPPCPAPRCPAGTAHACPDGCQPFPGACANYLCLCGQAGPPVPNAPLNFAFGVSYVWNKQNYGSCQSEAPAPSWLRLCARGAAPRPITATRTPSTCQHCPGREQENNLCTTTAGPHHARPCQGAVPLAYSPPCAPHENSAPSHPPSALPTPDRWTVPPGARSPPTPSPAPVAPAVTHAYVTLKNSRGQPVGSAPVDPGFVGSLVPQWVSRTIPARGA